MRFKKRKLNPNPRKAGRKNKGLHFHINLLVDQATFRKIKRKSVNSGKSVGQVVREMIEKGEDK